MIPLTRAIPVRFNVFHNYALHKSTGVVFVKQVGLKPGRKSEGVMDEQSGELEEEVVMGQKISESKIGEFASKKG